MGTWCLPQTKEKAERLEALMADDFPRTGAEDKIYHIFGDDELFDSFNEYEQNGDIRFSVAYRLKEILALPESSFRNPWDPEAVKICKGIVSRFGLKQ